MGSKLIKCKTQHAAPQSGKRLIRGLIVGFVAVSPLDICGLVLPQHDQRTKKPAVAGLCLVSAVTTRAIRRPLFPRGPALRSWQQNCDYRYLARGIRPSTKNHPCPPRAAIRHGHPQSQCPRALRSDIALLPRSASRRSRRARAAL